MPKTAGQVRSEIRNWLYKFPGWLTRIMTFSNAFKAAQQWASAFSLKGNPVSDEILFIISYVLYVKAGYYYDR